MFLLNVLPILILYVYTVMTSILGAIYNKKNNNLYHIPSDDAYNKQSQIAYNSFCVSRSILDLFTQVLDYGMICNILS